MAVSPEMIAVALGVAAPSSGSAQEQQWEMWINDAENAIQWRMADLGVVDPLDPEKVDLVVRKAVVAHIKHPDDATQVSVSVDDASTQRTYRSGSGEVSIKPEWWSLLGLVQDGAIGSFRLFGEPDVF